MRQLSDKEANDYGVHTVHHEMDNGELRFRLTNNSGSSYILTKSTACNGWQRAHIHYRKSEIYIVEEGAVIIALLKDNELKLRRLCRGETLSVDVGTPHNVFMYENTLLHTIKFGCSDEDWNEAPELDELIKSSDIVIPPKGAN